MFFGKSFSGYQKGSLGGLEIITLSIIKSSGKGGISGYSLMQEINEKFGGFRKATPGNMYPLLNYLSENGFVTMQEINENGRLKKMYEITTKGVDELKKVLESDLQPSITKFGDFIKMVSKAMPKFLCFPFPDVPTHCMFIPEEEDSSSEYIRIKVILKQLTNTRVKLKNNLDAIDAQIEEYEKRMKKIKNSRKDIDTTEDERELETNNHKSNI